MTRLFLVGLILTEWILVVAELTGDWQYYLWGFLVVVLWSEAIHVRDPKMYPDRRIRILFFGTFVFMFIVMNKSFFFIQEFGLAGLIGQP